MASASSRMRAASRSPSARICWASRAALASASSAERRRCSASVRDASVSIVELVAHPAGHARRGPAGPGVRRRPRRGGRAAGCGRPRGRRWRAGTGRSAGSTWSAPRQRRAGAGPRPRRPRGAPRPGLRASASSSSASRARSLGLGGGRLTDGLGLGVGLARGAPSACSDASVSSCSAAASASAVRGVDQVAGLGVLLVGPRAGARQQRLGLLLRLVADGLRGRPGPPRGRAARRRRARPRSARPRPRSGRGGSGRPASGPGPARRRR